MENGRNDDLWHIRKPIQALKTGLVFANGFRYTFPHLQPHLRLGGDLLRDHHDLVLRRLGTIDQPDFGKLTVSLSARIFDQDFNELNI